MAHQIQEQTHKRSPHDESSSPLQNIQQSFNNGYDARQDETNGDQTNDETEALTNALNPIQPKPDAGHQVDQANTDPNDLQKRQAERGGS